jgi:S-DNA-T family DNA segregation ATPase FtsK/SpoIIIE
VLDPATVAHVIGPSQTTDDTPPVRDLSDDLPEPLASVVEYMGADLDDGGREFVPTAELVDALNVEPTAFGRQMGELGCRPRPGRVMNGDGTSRQARGYLIADIRIAIEEALLDESEPDNGPA